MRWRFVTIFEIRVLERPRLKTEPEVSSISMFAENNALVLFETEIKVTPDIGSGGAKLLGVGTMKIFAFSLWAGERCHLLESEAQEAQDV